MTPARRRTLRALVLAVAQAASASSAQEAALSDAEAKRFFNAAGCNACHAVDEVRIGPPYRAVALRNADASPADVERLALKIVLGGAGAWGAVPMVSNPQVSAREARAAARWILALGPLAGAPEGAAAGAAE